MDSCEQLQSPPPEIRQRGFQEVMAFLYRVYEAQRTMVLDMAWLDLKILYINPTTLSGLTRLNLSGNQFEDLPHEIPFLTNLKCLTFDENKLEVLPPALGTITSIEKLRLRHVCGSLRPASAHPPHPPLTLPTLHSPSPPSAHPRHRPLTLATLPPPSSHQLQGQPGAITAAGHHRPGHGCHFVVPAPAVCRESYPEP